MPVLDLGRTAVANRLPSTPDADEARYPLEVGLCERCALVQLTWALPAEDLFDADYPYLSSVTDSLVQHARTHALGLVAQRGLGPESLVVEVGSNDGYLLQHLVEAGVPVLGVEPTPGPAAAARARGVRTVEAFFGSALARRLVAEHGRADVVVANNVLAHVPDLQDVLAGVALLLGPDGVATVENPGVGQLLDRVAFDTVYHEHYCYLSCLSVQAVAARAGLVLVDAEEFPALHGGTLRWHLAHGGTPSPRLRERLADERARGLDRVATYLGFGERVRGLQDALRAELDRLHDAGRTVAAYGAAAKGATLLGTTGVDVSRVAFVVDRSPAKQGRYLPGTGIPVLAPEELLARRPDVVLLLAWNVADEVVRQQADYLAGGGAFLVPVPALSYLGGPAPA